MSSNTNYKPQKHQQQSEKMEVELKCVTWSKDSHGLFDYESKSVEINKYRVDNSCSIIRLKNQEIKIIEQISKIDEQNSEILANIIQKDQVQQTYFVNPAKNTNNIQQDTNNTSNSSENGQSPNKQIQKSETNFNETFLIVRSLKKQQTIQKGYPLQINDLIKLGRIEYCIIETKFQSQPLQISKDIFCNPAQYNYVINFDKKEIRTCRICLSDEEQSYENPFINPCSCKGSCEYMHVSCIKLWIESKVHKKVMPNITTYKWKNLECEVCKLPLPKNVCINNQKMNLIDIERPFEDESYIIMESISREKKVSKGLYVIRQTLPDDSIKLGRGHTCDIRITDISVSRFHSYIKYEDDQFLIFDNNSKFGTLVKLDKNYPILQEKIAIQVGRTVMTFALKQTVVYSNKLTEKNTISNPQNNINNHIFRTTINMNCNNNNLFAQKQGNQQDKNKQLQQSVDNKKGTKLPKVNTFIISATNNIIGSQSQNNILSQQQGQQQQVFNINSLNLIPQGGNATNNNTGGNIKNNQRNQRQLQ